ncbi:metalloregulator ArsR/SmtB family transcription factor [Polynucleobacter sp. UK-Mo-2m-Kol15]|uniref:ArsR/SmtB family transcription factor n=1 Tax=Polynucleobacter sp. UK-Mo-2m-Kol15 TaxID=2576916 RepID=UPI001C0ACD0A|nr:metalloregulator ArsR/SmtB family transcription factor [Polynucleobacter sp. UK-Mo-2m-Kol15]
MRIYAYIIKAMNIKAKVKKATKDLSPKEMEKVFTRVAQYFTVLSEPSRLRIMYAVCSGEKSVSEVVELCGSSQANVSRHLAELHKAGILLRRKEGITVFYSIADNATVEMCQTVCAKIAESLH